MAEQERVAAFIAEHDLGGDASTWVHDLQSEVGEVAKEVLKASGYGSESPEFGEDMRNEVGDCYFSLLGLADALDIDLKEVLEDVLEKYEKRMEDRGSAGSGR